MVASYSRHVLPATGDILAASRRDLTGAFSSGRSSAVIATVSTMPDATGVAFIIYHARIWKSIAPYARYGLTAKLQPIDFL